MIFIKFPFSKKSEKLISDALLKEQVLSFPTETFYGLGGNALSKKVVERIYKIKGRSRNKPLIILINKDWLNQICFWNDSRVDDLMDTFWPGPLTLILKAKKELPVHLQDVNGSVAIRYTSSPIVQRLIEMGNCPLIGTSANLSGKPECFSGREVKDQLDSLIDMIIDDGKLSQKQPSTIINCQSEKLKVLRHGAISLPDLNRICEVI